MERDLRLMGTSLLVRVEARDRGTAIRAAEAAVQAVERTDDLLSTWRPDAELARLNAAPRGRPTPVSAALAGLLRECRHLTDVTGGAFDPTIGALVDAWDLRGPGTIPEPSRLAAARASIGWDRWEIGPGGMTRTDAVAWLDAGAFGKGAALRAARAALVATGARQALLNFGGQVLALAPDDAAPWRIPVADPVGRAEAVAELTLRAGSVATSGQSEQTRIVDGRPVGHVLDPRTGRPVPPWGSVTVVDPDPLRADALATALFVLGPREGRVWAERHHVAALFATRADGGAVLRPTSALRGLGVAAFDERTEP